MGQFTIDAQYLERLTPDGISRHDDALNGLCDMLVDKAITWAEFVEKCTSLAVSKEELFLIAGYAAIVASEIDF